MCLRPPRFGEVAIEATVDIGNTYPGAKDEGCALLKHGASELERSHRILWRIVDERPYLVRQLLVFNLEAHRGIPPRWLL